MNSTLIITLVASMVGLAIPLICQEVIREIIKKSFSDLSPAKIRLYFVFVVIGCIVIMSVTGLGISAAVPQDDDVENEVDHQVISGQTDYQNDTIQAIVDLTKTAIEKTEDYVNNKRTRDSIALANRDQYWAYSIGFPLDEESAAWDMAMEITSLGNISVFKESRKSFYVICDPGLDEKELQDSLQNYQSRLETIGVKYRIEAVNIMSYCGRNEQLIETDPITRRKHDESFKCLKCDK